MNEILLHNFLIIKGYIPLIAQNKRNIKNKCLLRTFNKKQKKIYKRRHIVENYHSWLKKFKKIKCLYERKMENFKGLLFIGAAGMRSIPSQPPR